MWWFYICCGVTLHLFTCASSQMMSDRCGATRGTSSRLEVAPLLLPLPSSHTLALELDVSCVWHYSRLFVNIPRLCPRRDIILPQGGRCADCPAPGHSYIICASSPYICNSMQFWLQYLLLSTAGGLDSISSYGLETMWICLQLFCIYFDLLCLSVNPAKQTTKLTSQT